MFINIIEKCVARMCSVDSCNAYTVDTFVRNNFSKNRNATDNENVTIICNDLSKLKCIRDGTTYEHTIHSGYGIRSGDDNTVSVL